MVRGLRLVAGGAMDRIDLQPPRQIGGSAEQLLVEVVPPPPDGLGHRNGRGDDVEPVRGGHAAPSRRPQPDHHTQEQTSWYAEAAFPDFDHVAPVSLETLVVGGHVVEPRPDESGDDPPHRDLGEIVGIATPFGVTAPSDLHRRHHPESDHQPVGGDP